MAGAEARARRMLGLANAEYLELHPDYENGYSGDRGRQAFQFEEAYESQSIHFVRPGTTAHEDLSGFCSWKGLAAFADGLYTGMNVAAGLLRG